WDLGPTYPQIFAEMGERLSELGYGFVLRSSGAERFDLEDLLKYVAPCLVVTLQELSEEQAQTLAAAGIPHLLIDLAAFVSLVGVTQIQYMHAQGRTRMLYVLPDHFLPDVLVTPRIMANQQKAQELGLQEPEVIRLPYTASGIADFERKLRTATPKDCGICAYTDEVAAFIYTMLGIDKFGPGKFGLIGVGNRPISNIGITTVRLDVDYWANAWVAPLLQTLQESTEPSGPAEYTMLIERRPSA